MEAARPRSVVYVSYDGLQDPLGQSQVLPYVRGLAARGHVFEVLSFEKPGAPLPVRAELAPGVRWTALRYHRRPRVMSTAFDIARGGATVRRLARQAGADLIHARSHVAAAMARGARQPLLFDTRGLLIDERADAGAWPRTGLVYRIGKKVERRLFRGAAAITVLTHSGQDYLRQEYPFRAEVRAPIRVIPTCADLDRFTPEGPREPTLAPRLEGSRVLVYLGASGPFYLAADMARFYLAWRRHASPARFLVVSPQAPDEIAAALREGGAAHELVHVAARHEDVPPLLRWAEAGVLFFRATFSKRASMPTKLGELLGCGIPLATNAIGDAERLFRTDPAGLLVDPAHAEGGAALLADRAPRPEVRRAARALAETWFSLSAGVAAYDRLYRALGAGPLPDEGWPPPGI